MTTRDEGLVLVEREAPFGRVRLALVDHANGFTRDACALTIDPLQMSDGRGGKLAVHGIGNVETMEAYRRRGLATQLMHASIERMRSGGADASLLYGIDGFYGPLGWRTCGDERWVSVDLESGARLEQSGAACAARPMRDEDLEAVTECYEAIASGVPGAILRPGDFRAWHLLDPEDVIIVERGDTLVGWAWRGRSAVHERGELATRMPDAAAFAELQALDEDAMRAVVAAACRWARDRDDEPGRTKLVTGAPEAHPLRRLARSGALACTLTDEVRPTGGAMLLALTQAGSELGTGLYQFLPDRF